MINTSLLMAMPKKIRNAVTDPDFKLYWNATNDGVEIRLDGVVGDSYTESDATSIRSVLSQHKGKPVTMRVASGGGLAFDGINIHNALAEHDGPTLGIIESLAASAAAVAVLGADKIQMNANATFMIHESIGMAYGHAWEIREMLEWMDRLDNAIMETISDKTGIELDIVRKHVEGNGDGTVFTAQEALDAGYVHEIIGKKEPKKQAKKNDTDQQRYRASMLKSWVLRNPPSISHVEERVFSWRRDDM